MKNEMSSKQGKQGIILNLTLATFCIIAFCCFSINSQAQKKYEKILVLAKVEQSDIEKTFEDAMAEALRDKGYNAVTSYTSFTNDEKENTDRLVAKADSLKIDALLAVTLINVETTIVQTPQVSANVGVPVNIGFFSVFVGGSVPLGGGPVERKTVHAEAGFYNDRNSSLPAWTMPLTGDLRDGTNYLIKDFVKKTIKALTKQKVL